MDWPSSLRLPPRKSHNKMFRSDAPSLSRRLNSFGEMPIGSSFLRFSLEICQTAAIPPSALSRAFIRDWDTKRKGESLLRARAVTKAEGEETQGAGRAQVRPRPPDIRPICFARNPRKQRDYLRCNRFIVE